MEFDVVVKKRKSVRSYESKKANWKQILEAIDSANQTPFAGNYNHLKFLIIEKKETIREIANICDQLWLNGIGILIVVCSDDSHLEDIYGDRGRIYSRQQAGAAIQTLLLKLTDLGLDSCWIGSYNDAEIKKELDIPVKIQIEAIIPAGYEKGNSPKKIKRDLDTTIFWEKWSQNRRPTKFEESKQDYFPIENAIKAKKKI